MLIECDKILKKCDCSLIWRDNDDSEDLFEIWLVGAGTLKFDASLINLLKNVEFSNCIDHIIDIDALQELTVPSKSEIAKWEYAYNFAKETPAMLLKFLKNKEVQNEFMDNDFEVKFTNERGRPELVFLRMIRIQRFLLNF